MHMAEVPEVRNEGQPNEYVYKSKVIDKILFANKPKDLPAITKQAIDNFPFDSTYYMSSTKEEIKAFYDKYIKISNDDIVDDEDTVQVFEAPKKDVPSQTVVVENTVKNEEASDISDDDLESLTADLNDDQLGQVQAPEADAPKAAAEAPTPAPTPTPTPASDDLNDSELDELLNGLG